ncbi:S-layer homology domain-containing protein [Brevibacillus gelatini]|uniref:S-layer homology domain-containing protein n=1 Tax=Brevibacillus gelatini TaxID=1655277 RepID=A0A3M8BEC1_9BACL|nr:S-layer homology domain-containing protein [Brevibacillus gelatini]RNB61726.1 S-layer homology domain-containing protein [Brevibacillus gelatini]
MKKVVNSVLASALALSVAPMAFAAEEATTTAPKMDADMEKTVKRLEALGLVAGYGNGEYGVDKTITRAEFATLIVRARGLEQGAKLAQFNTTYTDVKSTDWFAGFVNVASGEEIVKGFPDKSFKPQNQVTYAEAVTMIVRALGYEPAVRGVWPNSMISKASELNIAKSITTPNNAATRGDIFKMLDNALRVDLMEQVEYGTDVRFEVTDKTLLTKYLKVTVIDMEWAHEKDHDSDDLPLVTNVPAIGLGKLKANEITLNGKDAGLGNTTFKVADGINPNDFDGQRVQVWIKDDREDTIVWMEGSEDEEVILDRLDEFTLNGKTTDGKNLSSSDLNDLKVSLDASGKTYRFNKNSKITYNFKRYSDPVDALKEIIADNDSFGVKVVLNSDNEIAYMHVIDDTQMNKNTKVKYGSEVIGKIDADKKKITNLDTGKFNELDDKEEGKDFLVFLDGKPAKLSDLKEGDVYSVYYADGDKDKLLVFANRTVVEGKVDKVVSRNSNDYRLTVGDKTYRIYKEVTYSENGNKDVKDIDGSNWDVISNLDSETVKLYLDASGRVRHIETKDPIDDRKQKAIVVKAVHENTSKDTYDFTVLTQKGKKLALSLEKEDIYNHEGKHYGRDGMDTNELLEILQPSKDDSIALLEVTLDSEGEVDKVKILDSKLIKSSGSAWDKLADETDDVVGDYEVTDKTAIFKMTGELDTSAKRPELKNPGVVKFKDIADEDDLTVYYSVDEDKDEVEAIFVVDGEGFSSDTYYGVVTELNSAGKQDSIKVITKDGDTVTTKEYKLDDDREELTDRGIKRGDFIAFQLNSDDEVVVDDVIEVVDNKAIDDEDNVKLLEQSKWKKASIEKLTVARVDKVDGNTITYKVSDDETRKLYTKSSTAFIDTYDDFEAEDGVEEGDYIVLLDSSEIDGDRYDYVLIVGSEDWVEKEGISDKAVNDFLKQAIGGKPDPEVPEEWNAIPSKVDGKVFPIGSLNIYHVTVALNKDIKEEDIKSAVLEATGLDKPVVGKVENGEITFEFSGTFNASTAKITVTNNDGEKDTATVTFKK